MKAPYLIPRLNYKYRIKDFFYSVYSIFIPTSGTKYFKSFFGSENIYFTNHARTGLRLLLNSLGLKKNARIGVQAYNCHSVFNAITRAGFKPVFIDVNLDFQINLEDLDIKKTEIEALIITHTFGIPSDIEGVKRIFHGKPIIEDCAHAFLSKYKDKNVGQFGDAAIFSIGKAKFPSIGSGGIVVINNPKIIQDFNSQYSLLSKPSIWLESMNIFKNFILYYLHNPIIYNFFTIRTLKKVSDTVDISGKFSDKESRILKSNLYVFLKQLYMLEDCVVRQKQIQNTYISIVENTYQYNHFEDDPWFKSISTNGFMFPILSSDRERLIKEFKYNGIELGKHFSKSMEWAQIHGYILGSCPNAENITNTILTIPCYYTLSVKEINLITKCLSKIKI